jgi:hypothetical protein
MASPKKMPVKKPEAPANEPGEVDLEEIAAQVGSGMILASSLPDEFVGWIDEIQRKPDKRGNECVFVYIQLDEGGTTIIKYTKTQAKMFDECLKKLSPKPGEVHAFLWRRYSLGRGYPRHYPVKIVK